MKKNICLLVLLLLPVFLLFGQSQSCKSGYVNLEKGRIYYEEKGQGTPLIMIHGGGLDNRMWDDQFDVFSKKYRVVRYDVRNHGLSETEGGIFSYHEDLAALLDSLGISKAILMGLSMGGFIAIDFTLAYPDRVLALIPVSSGLTGYDINDPQVKEYEDKMRQAAEAGYLNGIIEYMQRSWTDGPYRSPSEVNKNVREKVRQMLFGTYSTWNGDAEMKRLDPPAVERLQEIQAPTLVVVGELDMPSILAIADLIEKDVPGSQKIIIKGAAHMVNMEKTKEFNAVVKKFLSNL
ncbi:MAG: alpha/beta hydrolase [Bacteroidetes bacterium]|nr:alpha/beta hydrolase [Bacteroidota bacterium]